MSALDSARAHAPVASIEKPPGAKEKVRSGFPNSKSPKGDTVYCDESARARSVVEVTAPFNHKLIVIEFGS
jgi:hypothetical protein